MKCSDCRESLLADPYQCTDELTTHLDNCSGCRDFASTLNEFEKDVQDALIQAVPPPPPPGNGVVKDAGGRQWLSTTWRRAGLNRAASISAVIILLAFAVWAVSNREEQLAFTADILNYAIQNPVDLTHETEIVPSELLAVMGVTLQVAPGWRTTYASSCKIANKKGVHLVFRKAEDVFTVFVLQSRLPLDTSRLAVQFGSKVTLVVLPSSTLTPQETLNRLRPRLDPL